MEGPDVDSMASSMNRVMKRFSSFSTSRSIDTTSVMRHRISARAPSIVFKISRKHLHLPVRVDLVRERQVGNKLGDSRRMRHEDVAQINIAIIDGLENLWSRFGSLWPWCLWLMAQSEVMNATPQILSLDEREQEQLDAILVIFVKFNNVVEARLSQLAIVF